MSLRPFPAAVTAAFLAAALVGCAAAGRFFDEALRERPPAPLDRFGVASDARIDSAGRLVGSFVGEGTSRAVHLISTDTALIAELVRRYRPNIRRSVDFWPALARLGTIPIPVRTADDPADRGALVQEALVGSPAGHTDVVVTAIVVRGGECGARGAQAEIVVEERRRGSGPGLRGPVVGSLLSGPAEDRVEGQGFVSRPAPEAPADGLTEALLARTRAAIDSALDAKYPGTAARRPAGLRVEVNTLADVDAADIVPFRVDDERVRYAVSLRERRIAGADTLVAAGVMVWDSAGAWRQTVLKPVYLTLRRGRLGAYDRGPGVYWRRLSAVTDIGQRRDNLWMEQVDTRDGTVLWGIVQPRDNVVVAAAEMEGPCR